MSGSFFGAATDQMREHAAAQGSAAGRLEDVLVGLMRAAESATWVGPDREGFLSGLHSVVHEPGRSLVEGLRAGARELEAHANEQDRASAADGGSTAGAGDDEALTDKDAGKDSDEYGGTTDLDEPVRMDDEAFDPLTIDQSGVGDCWFLAGSGAVGAVDKEFIERHIRDNGDGTYTVTLYRDGKPVEVTVDDVVINEGVRGPNGEPTWQTIYEKALMVYMGGEYEDIEGGYSGDAMEIVTGYPVDTRRGSDMHSLDDIEQALADGRPVTAGTGGTTAPRDDMVEGHSYIVQKVENGKIYLINPWGPDPASNDADPSNDRAEDHVLVLTEEEFRTSFTNTNVGRTEPTIFERIFKGRR